MQFNDAEASAAAKMEITDPVSTIMTRSVVVANESHHFSEVLRLFTKYDMHHLPIVDADGKLIGIMSSNDLVKAFGDPKYKDVTFKAEDADKAIKISDIMTPSVITISSKDTIKEAAKRLTENKILSLPVVDDGQIVGILTVKDMVQGLAYFS